MDTTSSLTHLAHIKIGTKEVEVPAGPTVVRTLKGELGVDPTFTLELVHGNEISILGDDQTVDVRSGLHFEAVPGGTVS